MTPAAQRHATWVYVTMTQYKTLLNWSILLLMLSQRDPLDIHVDKNVRLHYK
jgi:hypothetical protein